MLIQVLISVLVFGLSFLYWFVTRKYDYFKKLDVPQVDGKFPFGSVLGDVIFKKKPITDLMLEQYARFKVGLMSLFN